MFKKLIIQLVFVIFSFSIITKSLALSGQQINNNLLENVQELLITEDHQQPNEKNNKKEAGLITKENSITGSGYSTDTQQIVPLICYEATETTSGQQSYLQLDSALSYSQLEIELGIPVNSKEKYSTFSPDPLANYLRSIKDTDYSISLNYYEYITGNAAVQIAGYGTAVLTSVGKGIYNTGTNPYFGILCGDKYITGYQKGGLLTMAINIVFQNSYEKKRFLEESPSSYLNIVSAAEIIQDIGTEEKILGTVFIEAFQIGGDPGQISKFLEKSSSCSLTSMDSCVDAANDMLRYAKTEFPNQISFENDTGLSELGVAFSQYNPIEYIGLKPPPSLVTEEVEEYRRDLANKLKENEYYAGKLHSILDEAYPVDLNEDFLAKALLISAKSKYNIALLMQAHEGAADCFNSPDDCENIRNKISSELQSITEDDLSMIENIKYTVTTYRNYCTVYNTGANVSSWDLECPPAWYIDRIDYIKVDDFIFEYSYSFRVSSTATPERFDFSGRASEVGVRYEGTVVSYRNDQVYQNYTSVETRMVSPFFFAPYNIQP